MIVLVVVYTVVALNALRKRERVPRPWDLIALACRGALMAWDRAKEGETLRHRPAQRAQRRSLTTPPPPCRRTHRPELLLRGPPLDKRGTNCH